MLDRILGREAARALTARTAALRAVGLVGPSPTAAPTEAERAAATASRIIRLLGL